MICLQKKAFTGRGEGLIGYVPRNIWIRTYGDISNEDFILS
jgi:hypothetical protein